MYVCDSETGHRISGPFELSNYGKVYNACFSPDGKRILLEFFSCAVVWDIEMGEEQFQIKGYDFAFIHRDGRIASVCLVDRDCIEVMTSPYINSSSLRHFISFYFHSLLVISL